MLKVMTKMVSKGEPDEQESKEVQKPSTPEFMHELSDESPLLPEGDEDDKTAKIAVLSK